jgi:hypothetical protein
MIEVNGLVEDRGMEPANDMQAASRTYSSFIGTLKWSVPLIAVIVFVIILVIV